MEIRLIDLERDYNTVKEWWLAYKKTPVKKELFPKVGFMAEEDGKPLAACWAYRTDSPVVCLEPMVGNPNINKGLRAEAINGLFKAVIEYTRMLGAKHILAISSHPALAEKGKALGFSEVASEQKVYYKAVE